MEDWIKFSGIIKKKEGWEAAFVDFPFSVEELFNKKGQVKVMVLFDDKVSYRGSLAKMKSTCHILGLTKEVRLQLGKSYGDEISVKLKQDKEERIVEIPQDVQILFDANKDVFELYNAMSYTHRKEYIRWITDAKKTETRESRKNKMLYLIRSGQKGI